MHHSWYHTDWDCPFFLTTWLKPLKYPYHVSKKIYIPLSVLYFKNQFHINWRTQEFQNLVALSRHCRILWVGGLFWCPFTNTQCFCCEVMNKIHNYCKHCILTTIKIYVSACYAVKIYRNNHENIFKWGARTQCVDPESAFDWIHHKFQQISFYFFDL